MVGPFEGQISEDTVSRPDLRQGANDGVMLSLVRFLEGRRRLLCFVGRRKNSATLPHDGSLLGPISRKR